MPRERKVFSSCGESLSLASPATKQGIQRSRKRAAVGRAGPCAHPRPHNAHRANRASEIRPKHRGVLRAQECRTIGPAATSVIVLPLTRTGLPGQGGARGLAATCDYSSAAPPPPQRSIAKPYPGPHYVTVTTGQIHGVRPESACVRKETSRTKSFPGPPTLRKRARTYRKERVGQRYGIVFARQYRLPEHLCSVAGGAVRRDRGFRSVGESP